MLSPHQQHFIDHILAVEGGFVDDAADSGGATRFGITVTVARKHGYRGDMKTLPKETAIDIYLKDYWHALMLDNVAEMSPEVAYKLADIGVNMGIARAGEFFQRSLNVMNNRGRIYPDIKVDGAVGPRTVGVAYAFFKRRKSEGERVMLEMLNCLQGEFYISLAERRQKDEKFVYGWFMRILKGKETT